MQMISAMEDAERMLKGNSLGRLCQTALRQIKKMGPLSQVMGMLPGQLGQAAKQVDPREIDGQLKSVEAIIASMTPAERRDPRILNASRRRRIARGCGKDVQAVNRLMKQFRDMQNLMKRFQKPGSHGNIDRLFG